MAKLSKQAKQEWDFFINPETGRRTYNSLCRKCKTNASKVTKRLLSFVRIINPKEVRKSNLITVNSMTAVKAINHFKKKLKIRTKRKNRGVFFLW